MPSKVPAVNAAVTLNVTFLLTVRSVPLNPSEKAIVTASPFKS